MPEWFGGSALNPRMIINERDQWILQWNRVERWSERVSKIKKKSKLKEIDEYDLDTIIAFIQNCFHLGDWIKSTHPEIRDQWNRFQNEHFEMGACRDICNGYKHRKLTNWSHDPHFNFYRIYDYIEEMRSEEGNHVKWMFAFDDGGDIRKYEVFEFIDGLEELVKKFVSDAGLLEKDKC